MVDINGKYTQEELDELAKPCPNNLCFSYSQKTFGSSTSFSLVDWYWIFRINGKIYDMLNLNKIPFISHSYLNKIIMRLPYDEQFNIDFSMIPENFSEIEVGLENMGKDYRYPMREIETFYVRMLDIGNKEDIKIANEFCFTNKRKVLNGKQLHLGTFARVNDFWRFYPRMEDVERFWDRAIYPEEKDKRKVLY